MTRSSPSWSTSSKASSLQGSIRAAVERARVDLEPTAKITEFLPVLVGRFAKEQLTAAAQVDGRISKPVPEILFICVHNAGRSQTAGALIDHLSAGRVHVRTAGSQPADQINPEVVTVLAERGIDLNQAYPKPLNDDVVMASDVIITMGCGDACPIYPGKRYEDWDVADPAGQPLDVVRQIRDDIQQRVTNLLRQLGI
jgi:arsenate reductase